MKHCLLISFNEQYNPLSFFPSPLFESCLSHSKEIDGQTELWTQKVLLALCSLKFFSLSESSFWDLLAGVARRLQLVYFFLPSHCAPQFVHSRKGAVGEVKVESTGCLTIDVLMKYASVLVTICCFQCWRFSADHDLCTAEIYQSAKLNPLVLLGNHCLCTGKSSLPCCACVRIFHFSSFLRCHALSRGLNVEFWVFLMAQWSAIPLPPLLIASLKFL